MNKNKQLNTQTVQSKLAAYSLVAVAAVTASTDANAEIQSVFMDSTMTNNTIFEIDLDGNGTIDIEISQKDGVTNGYDWNTGSVKPVNGAGIEFSTSMQGANVYNVAVMVDNGSMISSLVSFNASVAYLGEFYEAYTSGDDNWGPWGQGGVDKYIGVKLMIDGNAHYGYVGLTIPIEGHNFVVNGYAYEDQMGVGINAGDAVGVAETRTSDAKIYSYGRSIRINGSSKGASVEVYDLSGKQVHSSRLSARTGTVEMKSSGMYVVRVTANGNTSSQKVYIN
ncbi:MAG: T9SS type A sorting domain-containing protein [Flavobacteriales bacterium]|nr:T9SS type A sorting domain-containing protein [Flavobacteriales bacterium]